MFVPNIKRLSTEKAVEIRGTDDNHDLVIIMVNLNGNVVFERIQTIRHNMYPHSKVSSIIHRGSGQFDPPNTNFSSIIAVWKVIDDAGFSGGEAILNAFFTPPVLRMMIDKMERDYATFLRDYAVKNKLTFNGGRLTMDTPVEAFYYKGDESLYVYDPAFPPRNDEEEEE